MRLSWVHEIAAAYALPQHQRPDIRAHLEAARTAAGNVRDLLAATDTGVFENWHRSDEKFRLNALIQTINKAAQRFN